MGRPHRSKAVTMSVEISFCNRFKHLFEALLNHSVQYTWDTKRSLLTIWLRNPYTTNLFWSIVGQLLANERYNFFFRLDADVVHCLAVCSSSIGTFVGFDCSIGQKKDGATRQILADCVVATLELPMVERTFQRLLERLDGNIHPEAIIHSDQGMHYTHPKTRQLIAEAGFKQSMSRKGNCWDNAPMESFSGHMKDEVDFIDCQTIEEVRVRVRDSISFYNSERYQWTLKKMTPDEFRGHLLAG